jgi:hypothetical protein
MKKLTLLFASFCIFNLLAAQSSQRSTIVEPASTNDFYDDAPQFELAVQALEVTGEIEKPYSVNFNTLPLRQVIVKETEWNGLNGKFIGAYQYEGYSLYDILDQAILKKENAETFPPIIDLYVEVENANGEKVIFSWGELYYPINRHQILIASKVRRIVPSKTKDLWILPENSKLVVSSDLYTERNIEKPVKITVKSAQVEYNIDRQTAEMFSPKFTLTNFGKTEAIDQSWKPENTIEYNTVFYGRGMGIHSTTPFNGIMVKELLKDKLVLNREVLRKGMIVTAGMDGYRGVFTVSEIFNRNDQAELLLVKQDEKGTGAYQLFPAMDFFSDRAIKVLSDIRYLIVE